MSRLHVDHAQISAFAKDHVNLPKDKADEFRAQAARLREKLEGFLKEHPDFDLKKMLLSGSLAKGTALRSLNDIDVACYISGADAPRDAQRLLTYLTERLRRAFPNFKPEQITPQTYSVTVSFRGTGLDVDVVPILYGEDPNWYGDLVSQDDGHLLETCIPRHLEFIKRRKAAHDTDFAQVARLLKFWVCKLKRENEGFRLKSFMIELVLAHLADQGFSFSDYPKPCSTSLHTWPSRGSASGSCSATTTSPPRWNASMTRSRSSIRSTRPTTLPSCTPRIRLTRSSTRRWTLAMPLMLR